MLAVETSEIGATLIALSVPGIKPIFDRFIFKTSSSSETANSQYGRGTGGRSKGTALSTLRLHSQHSRLMSQENTAKYGNEISASSQRGGDDSQKERGGISVRVDFDFKEEAQQVGMKEQRQPRLKHGSALM